MLIALSTSPTVPWVRVPDPSEGWIKRALDAGAATVIVPRVDDLDTARRLAGFATYGPEGRRGVGVAVARAARLGPRRRALPRPLARRAAASPSRSSRRTASPSPPTWPRSPASPSSSSAPPTSPPPSAPAATTRASPRPPAPSPRVARAAGTRGRHRHLPRPRLRRARRPRLHPRPRRQPTSPLLVAGLDASLAAARKSLA